MGEVQPEAYYIKQGAKSALEETEINVDISSEDISGIGDAFTNSIEETNIGTNIAAIKENSDASIELLTSISESVSIGSFLDDINGEVI